MAGNLAEAIQRARDSFIQMRAEEERKIAEFGKQIASIDIKTVFGDLEIPSEISLKALCPEIYKDSPNPDVYEEQYTKMDELFKEMNKRISSYYGEVLECLQSYRAIS